MARYRDKDDIAPVINLAGKRHTGRAMSQDNVEIVRRGNALLNAGDWDAFFDLCHPDVEYRDLQPAPGTPDALQGREALRALAARWVDAFDDFGAEVYDYIDVHPWVICGTRWHGKGKGGGVPIDVHGVDTYEIKDGKVARMIMSYSDLATAFQAVAQAK